MCKTNYADLEKMVKDLETLTGEEKIIKKLQEIGAALINEYVIRVGDLTIEPLWVEAYYYNQKNFPDCNTHLSEKQKNRFGQFYFHEEGRGGFDICLSNSPNFYLSFLLKATLIDDKFTTQTGIYDVLNNFGKKESEFENEKNILFKREENKSSKIMHTQRIGITKSCYHNQDLAVFPIDALSNDKYNFTFARKNLEPIVEKEIKQYITENPNCTKQKCKEVCKNRFGWVPDIISHLVKDFD